MKKLTPNQYVKWIINNRPDYEVLEDYAGDNVKILHHHVTTKLKWMCTPGKFKSGISHPLISRQGRPLRKTHAQYVTWVKDNRPDYEVLEKYKNTKTKILHRHVITNTTFSITPEKFINGHTHTSLTNCPRWDNDLYLQYILDNNIPVQPLDKFITQHTPIKHKCINTNTIYSIAPKQIIQNKKYTHIPKITNTQEYKTWLNNNYPELVITEEYVNSHYKINHLLVSTGECWKVKPNNVIQGQHHPCTSPSSYSRKSIDWLNSLQIPNIQHAKQDGEFTIPNIGKVDGYCKETNTVYEFHGDFWHGNPSIFNSNDIHPIIKKTFGELYHNTITREEHIIRLGYTLVVMWECEYNKHKQYQ
jgi:ribosomal protein S18